MKLLTFGLKNFRCFKSVDVNFRPITILTGANSAGKSTLLLAIMAMLQGLDSRKFPFVFSPNGEYCTLGSYKNVIFRNDINDNVELSASVDIDDSGEKATVCAEYEHSKNTSGFGLKRATLTGGGLSFDMIKNKDKCTAYISRISPETKCFLEHKKHSEALNKYLSKVLQDMSKDVMPKLSPLEEPNQVGEAIVVEAKTLQKLIAKISGALAYGSSLYWIAGRIRGIAEETVYIGPSRFYPSRVYLSKDYRGDKISPTGENAVDIIESWKKSKKTYVA